MEVYAQPFWTPKAGNSEVEYEDAFYPPHIIEAKTNSFRFAIADGATETSFAKLWAQLLVKAVGKGRLDPVCPDRTLTKLRSCWQRVVSRKSLPWYAEEKVRLGAFSSILGLSLSEDLTGRYWNACAIGDCCLFHVRGNNLLRSFPLSHSSEFNNRPRLISSIPECAAASGRLTSLQGVYVKVLFVWLPVGEVDRSGDTLSFYIGPVSTSFPLSDFAHSPHCRG
ncbi:MAG: DUF538 domain-containing protein, partial [Nitrospirae bacterium]|nr:DUF538 domain-containing protein [Nitrospirota bacterium]